jgi:hypothetical protein
MYPVINPSMEPHKRAQVFHIYKTALCSQTIDLQIQLDALGYQLNLGARVNGVIHNWLRQYKDHWFNFSQLVILSFHDKKGNQVNNTTIAGDPSVLLPVINGTLPIVAGASSLCAYSSPSTSLAL